MTSPETAAEWAFLQGLTAGHDRAAAADDWAEADAARARLAATLVRRRANQHRCKGAAQGKPPRWNGKIAVLLHKVFCTSRNHRRDVAYCKEMLEMLDLPGNALATREDYEGPVAYVGAMGKREARDWAKN